MVTFSTVVGGFEETVKTITTDYTVSGRNITFVTAPPVGTIVFVYVNDGNWINLVTPTLTTATSVSYTFEDIYSLIRS